MYALLGLSSFRQLSKDSMPIVPNYKISKLDVYTSVVETAIRFHGTLRILSHAESIRNLSEDWPTWVPRWNLPSGLVGLGSPIEKMVHRTNGDCKLGPHGEGWRMGHNILTVRGIAVATVKAVGDLMTSDHFHTAGKKMETVILHPIVRFFTDALNESPGILKEGRLNQMMSFCYGLTAGENLDFRRVQEHSDEHLADFAMYMSKSFGLTDSVLDLCEVFDPNKHGNAERYEIAASRMCVNRKLLKTSQGHIGIGPLQRKVVIVFAYCLVTSSPLFFVSKERTTNF
jgi:hypothetical protein